MFGCDLKHISPNNSLNRADNKLARVPCRLAQTLGRQTVTGIHNMDWFDPSDDVVIQPSVDRARFWSRKYGTDHIEIAPQVLFVNNGHGRLFDAVCQALDQYAVAINDHRHQGYCHYRASSGHVIVYRAPEPAPYAAADLEFLMSAGAQQIVFVNGAGSLRADLPVGSVLLPEGLLREEGTSFHYVPAGAELHTNEKLNRRILVTADE